MSAVTTTAAPKPAVAFLGLGALGAPMAANILAAGFPLTVHTRSRWAEQLLARSGARRAASPAEASRGADLLCLCLSDDTAVRQVLLGEMEADGIAADPGDQGRAAITALAPGSLVIDFSTIAPATSRALAAVLAQRGVGYLDAPVTGGTEGAAAGSLSILVGGPEEQLERARPLLEVVGSRITHFGAVGSGQNVKAVNQILVAGSYAAVAEGLALARRLGLPLQQVCEALRGGAAGSWALEHRSGHMIANHYPLGFRLALHRKDLAIALEAAAAAGQPLPISAAVAAIEDTLIAAGHGDDDVSGLARWFMEGA